MLVKIDRKACLAAIEGKDMPPSLDDPLYRVCIIRGIRHHHGFGKELRGVHPDFTRSLNARGIMSNAIPDSLDSPEEVPYCIWHPDTASEETYRELAKRFPQMAYQVGRACAVAGYTQLFMELALLPDVHIAEEARECGNLAIFEAIISEPVRYSIMNDYTRTIDLDNRTPANLNGDTCARWMLEIKQELRSSRMAPIDVGYEKRMFNITEDMHIDENESDEVVSRLFLDRTEVQLLSEPLPADLPTVQKDLLIAMAAYHGDIDRYTRLRRPQFIRGELACCVRGIYHNTQFAVWWSKQPDMKKKHADIDKAIAARFIMNNVLSGAPFKQKPYLIWYPTQAQPETYQHLAKLQPEMLPQIVHACIFAGYPDIFDELLPQVTVETPMLREAEHQANKHFLQALWDRVESTGIAPRDPPQAEFWRNHMFGIHEFGRSSNYVMKYMQSGGPGHNFEYPYNGRRCDMSDLDLAICLPDAWKLAADDERDTCYLDYVDWPPSKGDN